MNVHWGLSINTLFQPDFRAEPDSLLIFKSSETVRWAARGLGHQESSMDEQALRDGQVWESDGSLIQVNETGGGYVVANFRVSGGSLEYTDSVVYKDANRLIRLLKRLGMKPTDKVITLCEAGS